MWTEEGSDRDTRLILVVAGAATIRLGFALGTGTTGAGTTDDVAGNDVAGDDAKGVGLGSGSRGVLADPKRIGGATSTAFESPDPCLRTQLSGNGLRFAGMFFSTADRVAVAGLATGRDRGLIGAATWIAGVVDDGFGVAIAFATESCFAAELAAVTGGLVGSGLFARAGFVLSNDFLLRTRLLLAAGSVLAAGLISGARSLLAAGWVFNSDSPRGAVLVLTTGLVLGAGLVLTTGLVEGSRSWFVADFVNAVGWGFGTILRAGSSSVLRPSERKGSVCISTGSDSNQRGRSRRNSLMVLLAAVVPPRPIPVGAAVGATADVRATVTDAGLCAIVFPRTQHAHTITPTRAARIL